VDPITPAPNEKMVRDALLSVLRRQGLTPEESWVAIRLVSDGPSAGMYIVVIAEHAARLALSIVLPYRPDTVGNEIIGVWGVDRVRSASALRRRVPRRVVDPGGRRTGHPAGQHGGSLRGRRRFKRLPSDDQRKESY
jgi:hypothetical protein